MRTSRAANDRDARGSARPSCADLSRDPATKAYEDRKNLAGRELEQARALAADGHRLNVEQCDYMSGRERIPFVAGKYLTTRSLGTADKQVNPPG